MTVQVLKCEPEPFQAIKDGSKPFEWRKEDDRAFAVGDLLVLLEHRARDGWVKGNMERTPAGYTGEVLKRRVTYVLRGEFDVPKGYVVLGLAVAREPQDEPAQTALPQHTKGLYR